MSNKEQSIIDFLNQVKDICPYFYNFFINSLLSDDLSVPKN